MNTTLNNDRPPKLLQHLLQNYARSIPIARSKKRIGKTIDFQITPANYQQLTKHVTYPVHNPCPIFTSCCFPEPSGDKERAERRLEPGSERGRENRRLFDVFHELALDYE